MALLKHIPILFFLIILTHKASGNKYDYKYYPFFKYTQTNGLSSYNAKKIVEDPWGIVWIATQDGLNRFDGLSFLQFNKTTDNPYTRLLNNDITELVIDKKRDLIWVASSSGGLNAIGLTDLKVKESVPVSPQALPLKNDWIHSMKICNDEIWIGTNNGLAIYNIPQKRIIAQCKIPFTKDENENFVITDILPSVKKAVYVCVKSYGIIEYDEDSKEMLSFSAYNTDTNRTGYGEEVHNLLQTTEWGILAVTDRGIKRLNSPATNGANHLFLSLVPELLFLKHQDIQSMLFDKQGQLWFVNTDGLFSVYPKSGRIYNIKSSKPTAELDKESSINQIYFDSNDNIWLATMHGVMTSANRSSAFRSYTAFNNGLLKINHVYSLGSDKKKSQFIFCTKKGLLSADKNTSSIFSIDRENTYYSLFSVYNNELVFCSERGLRTKKNDKIISAAAQFPELNAIKNEVIGAGYPLRDSLVILTSFTSKGVWIWNLKRKKISYLPLKSSVNPNKSTQNNCAYIDNTGNVLLACNQGIYHYSKENVLTEIQINNPINGKDFDLFFDIFRIKGGYVITCYGDGVLIVDTQFKLKKHITTADGLANSSVYNIYPLNDSVVLISSNNGVSRINCLNYDVTSYFEEDGLVSNSLEFNFNPRGVDRICLNSINGFTFVDTGGFYINSVIPKIYFQEIRLFKKSEVTDTVNLDINTLRIPPNTLQTTISFAGINYSNPQRTTFSYKITELHKNWIKNGSRNFVTLIGLNPGTYHLQVQAFNENGLPSEIKELSLIFLPKWNQTWWFKLFLLMVAIGAVYALYRIRINQLKKEQQIRSKLASDLHDDLGSTLNSVKVYANLAMLESQKEKHLFKIKDSIQEAITGVKDMIWVLDDKKDSLPDLLSRVSQFGAPLCEANHVLFKQVISDNAREYILGREEKRNLYMMLKEAVNNTIKYAAAAEIEISVQIKKAKPEIRFTDDGNGFDPDITTEGNGLNNMRRRASQMHYTVDIQSSPGKGTSIVFRRN